MEGLRDNFTILQFFSLLKLIHCVILCNLSCRLFLSLIGILNYYEGKIVNVYV